MDPEDLRDEIPAVDDTVYLNTGASGPSPRPVVEAATDFLERHEYEAHAAGDPYSMAYDELGAAREHIAAFVGADPDDLALTNSTADGISRIAAAVDWEPGDTVVYTDLEHPAGILPWERAADVADIDTRVLDTERGRVEMDAVKEVVDDARLLCLSSLSWNYGTRLPVAEIVDVAHDAGTRVVVDAVQSPGQHPVDVAEWGADAVAAAGHKWLLGLWGAGFLHVDPDFAAELEPRRASYRSVDDPSAAGCDLSAGAHKLEIGTVSPAPHVAAATAIDRILAVGLDTVQKRIERLTDRLKSGLGDRLLSPREYESGLVTFRADDPEELVDQLGEDGVVIRSLPDGTVRASIHVFNTADDVDRLLRAL
ncbi:cysteine desulfurase [Halorientalis sp. IM1011]|uniref:aminotransferase class V-fold PLP-dependent enzyme n=1 Tax=Halorientalis sp. IM1011 TaxID=1932360 RepID=UPI00097CC689|nr:aminotransferase class V-fold PLP-dependent enzyme [Halorientalis sp. IM1011]AQL42427.1 cysteine desulfurase [Halorientalis sp. IM1011]